MDDMAAITRDEELEVVKTAYFLEDRITKLKKECAALRRERPREPTEPQKPTEEHTKISPTPYPPIDLPADISVPDVQLPPFWKRGIRVWKASVALFILSSVLSAISYVIIYLLSSNFLMIVFFVLGLIAGLASQVGFYVGIVFMIQDWLHISREKKRIAQETEAARKAAIEAAKNSPEYHRKCQEVDERNRIRQAELDKENHEKYLKQYEKFKVAYQNYEAALRIYKTQTIPEWSEEVAELDHTIEQTNAVLNEVYGKGVIPIPYRNIPALCYLMMFLSTSNYDLKFAIERYDTYVIQTAQQRQIEIAEAQLAISREALRDQQYSTWLNEQIAEMTEQGNKTLKSISSWQRADILLREYRLHKARKAQK